MFSQPVLWISFFMTDIPSSLEAMWSNPCFLVGGLELESRRGELLIHLVYYLFSIIV